MHTYKQEDRRQEDRRLLIEEIANSLTHGIGLILSLAGMAMLIFHAWAKGGQSHIIACSIYGVTLVLVYAASTLYHGVQNPRIKHIFNLCDHAAIYLVIAGTYTPFTMISLRGFWGWTLLVLVWSLSLFGIAFKIVFVNRYKAVSMALYLVIGWLAIIAAKPIISSIPLGCVILIASGAAAYMTGLVFFAWERLPFSHTIWHVFVIVGSVCHYCAIAYYVVPAR
ncbi:MAG: hemolysin III family protein [Blastocatellia bacterium]|nr:hemolysin III family protein [Blastocatellia bacterium]